ncbi:MAG: ABC transporter ATP-binding protein [Eubacteriales bacterium]|jgi:ATP-binding cassette subfamily B protein|nr:ABC transporter ATP-binding protein [Eubacteriales bacterium]MDD4104645.1 ABC transporter ATP-binding protein [Eubacteriales bacterium]MDD4710799.1 ABC transporter ATP-binding protein [Eubacteriales bacterium]NLO14414.1 ABC transporter ATP-binding protein [Clostridiales bacterium]
MNNPGKIGGGRLTRAEQNNDTRREQTVKMPRRKILARLWQYLGRYRRLLILAIALVLLSNLFVLVGPKLSGMAIDAVGVGAGEADFPRVLRLVALMVACYALSALLRLLLQKVMLRLRRNVIYRMRKDVFDSLISLPVGYFDGRQTGDILSVISYDIDTVNESLSGDFIQVLQSLVTVVVSFIMMLTIAPRLVLIFAVTVPLSFFYTRWIAARVRPLYARRSQRLGQLNGFMEEMMDGQKTTKAYGREKEVLAAFDEQNEQAVSAYTRAEYMGTLVGASVNFINNVSLALVSVLGGLLYLSGGVGLGDISSFVQYSRKFSGPINEMANIIGDLQSAFAAAERVLRLMDATPEKPDAPDAAKLEAVRGDVTMKNVDFGYTQGVPVIQNFSMHARAGSVIAIVGETGAGKTTIINLLMRFYDIDRGSIRVDGKDIYHVTRDSLRRAYTMVLQDTWLFSGTIFDNIAYGKPGATRVEVERAARAAMIHNFIVRLPKGYDTMIGDSGANISKGQKQLMTIARAMLLDSKMLILDEATSNVDTRTEQKIQAAMRQLMEGRTSFVIAHRLSTIRNADHILVVDDGNIAEQGTHEQLMAQNGPYSKLYYAQFETY